MPLTDDTLKVRIKRMPSTEPPLKPYQRWALLGTGALVLGLVLYCASILAARPDNPNAPNLALTPAPPNATRRPGAVPTAADGTPLIDLVCGAPVDDTAPYRTEFYGKTFYFAHAECLERFRAKPQAYVKVKVNVNVKMNPDQASPGSEEPVPEATADVPAEEPSAPTVTDGAPSEPQSTPEATVPNDTPPAATHPEPASEPAAGPVPQPNPDGSVWKDASGNPEPQDNGQEPGWLPPDPGSAPQQSVPADDSSGHGNPGWVPGAEPNIESQPVNP